MYFYFFFSSNSPFPLFLIISLRDFFTWRLWLRTILRGSLMVRKMCFYSKWPSLIMLLWIYNSSNQVKHLTSWLHFISCGCTLYCFTTWPRNFFLLREKYWRYFLFLRKQKEHAYRGWITMLLAICVHHVLIIIIPIRKHTDILLVARKQIPFVDFTPCYRYKHKHYPNKIHPRNSNNSSSSCCSKAWIFVEISKASRDIRLMIHVRKHHERGCVLHCGGWLQCISCWFLLLSNYLFSLLVCLADVNELLVFIHDVLTYKVPEIRTSLSKYFWAYTR